MRLGSALVIGLALAVPACGDDTPGYDVLVAETELAAAQPAPTGITLGGSVDEMGKRVVVQSKPHDGWRVAYSVRVEDVRAGERLLLRGQVTVSRCNKDDIAGKSTQKKSSACFGTKQYGYDPNVSVALILADGANQTKGKLLARDDERCTEHEHHCARAITNNKPYFVKADRPLKFVNLVVSANAKSARTGEVVEIEPESGGLHVIRIGADRQDAPATDGSATILLPGNELPILDDVNCAGTKRQVVYSSPVGVTPGDILEVAGEMKVKRTAKTGSVTPLVGSFLLFTHDETATGPTGPADVVVLPKNGSNCPKTATTCTNANVGALQVPAGADPTMRVNFVAYATRHSATCSGNETLDVVGGDVRWWNHGQ